MPRTVLLTGASSGIGEALALHYAKTGSRLGLIGRNDTRLHDVAARCRAVGAGSVDIGVIDVRAADELAAWVETFERESPVDLVIAGAGIVGGATTPGALETVDTSRDILTTNIIGVVNAVHAVLPGMLRRGSGQIAVISSLAGFITLPDLPSYSASKSAVTRYALALRDSLRIRGIRVSVACPGYVDTPMGRQLVGRKAFMVTPDKAAQAIACGLARDRRLIAFPFLLACVTRLSAVLPDWLIRLGAPSFGVQARDVR